jgi:hypothetical protein
MRGELKPRIIVALVEVALVAVLTACQSNVKPEKQAEQSSASQDCVLPALTPLLSTSGGTSPSFEKLGAYEVEEHISVDNNTDVVVRQFGCSEYRVEFAFLLHHEDGSTRSSGEWLRRSAELLRKLKISPAQQTTVQDIADSLDEAASNPYQLGNDLPLSDMDTVSVKVETAPTETKLTVHYEITF